MEAKVKLVKEMCVWKMTVVAGWMTGRSKIQGDVCSEPMPSI